MTMKNKELKGILALVVVTALSFGVIAGSKMLSQDMTDSTANGTGNGGIEITEAFDVNGSENIDAAGKTADGYLVTVREKGYAGDIVLDVIFDGSGNKITNVSVVEQSETDGVGSKIADAEFLSQFAGIEAPVTFAGYAAAEDSNAALETLEGAALTDGTYTASTDTYDDSGFMDELTLTVKDGKITEVNWDAVTEDGTKKSVMSENGEYTMTEDGPTWKEQAEALAAALVENQSLSFFTMDNAGKTDAVASVSISIGGFVNLAQQCLEQAAGIEAEKNSTDEAPAGTPIDAVSGATISSTAAVTAINNAYSFLQTVK
ncbi:MAG: FMN-binding protein [Marvinbryantia sp.]|jgi:Na+-translocating ferredoxin:NAD+ oxidoreductase RnfG subunit